MRIGEVNKDNYKDYLKLFNVKNAKEIEENIDRVWGKDKEEEFDEAAFLAKAEKEWVAKGWVEEGMVLKSSDDGSWRKIVPISDDVKEKLIETIRRQFLEDGTGMVSTEQGDELGALYKEFRKSIPPSERLSFTHTLNQIRLQEANRLIDYVKANQPGWKHGDPIDKDVLERAVSGEHVDVKA